MGNHPLAKALIKRKIKEFEKRIINEEKRIRLGWHSSSLSYYHTSVKQLKKSIIELDR